MRRRSGSDRRSDRDGWRRAGRSGVLLALLLVAMVAGAVPVVHSHDAQGLYDQECLFSCLAAGKPSLPSSVVAAQAQHVPVPDPTPVVVGLGPTEATLAAFDSRGPPR